MKICSSFSALLFCFVSAFAADSYDMGVPRIYLWAASTTASGPEEWMPGTDGFHRVRNIHSPSIFVFLPPKEKATGAAFIVCPGGGHNYLVMDLEGANVARRLNQMGIAAFVLESRLAHTKDAGYRVDVESLQDAQRAIRLVRSRAKEWNLDAARVGIMGFSAGGEIAALAATRFDMAKSADADPIDKLSSRPDVAVLGYPGLRPPYPSVPKNAPATFLVVNNDDNLAPASAEFYLELRKAGVPAELLVYNRGGHGFGMTGRTPEFQKMPVASWPERLQEWLTDVGFLQH
jgi:acetyl esterase/lipase